MDSWDTYVLRAIDWWRIQPIIIYASLHLCKCQCFGMILMHLPSALLRSNQRGRELPDHKSSALSAQQRRILDLYVSSSYYLERLTDSSSINR